MKIITDINQLDSNGTYTYADYLLWKFKERVELFKGKILEMSPAPARKHQDVSGNIYLKLGNFFKNKKCKLYSAPFDVRFPNKNDDNIYSVVQPDLCVICDMEKLDDRGCLGAPDLIIEILSPGNTKKEMKYKFDLYEEAGVQEYWVVYPSEENVYVNVLENGEYRTLRPIVDDYVTSLKFPDLKIHTSEIFAE